MYKYEQISSQFKYHHPMSNSNNLHILRKKDGRGILCIYYIYTIELSNMATNLEIMMMSYKVIKMMAKQISTYPDVVN